MTSLQIDTFCYCYCGGLWGEKLICKIIFARHQTGFSHLRLSFLSFISHWIEQSVNRLGTYILLGLRNCPKNRNSIGMDWLGSQWQHFFRNHPEVQIPAAEIIFFIKRQTVWPDLATFDHFGKYLNIFANIFKVNLVWGKVFNSHWHNLYAFGQFFTIWSPGHTERRSKFFKKTKKEVLLRCRLRIILLSPPLHAIVETSKTVNSFELNSFKNCLVLFWN